MPDGHYEDDPLGLDDLVDHTVRAPAGGEPAGGRFEYEHSDSHSSMAFVKHEGQVPAAA